MAQRQPVDEGSSVSVPSSPHRSLTTPSLLVGAMLLLLVGLVLAAVTQNVWLQIVMLGIVEGLTEFLPISSTAHLLITADLIGFQHSIDGTFEIFIQLGAVLAVLGFYARELVDQARALPTSSQIRSFWLGIFVAFLPAAIVGLTLRDWIKEVVFESPVVIAGSLIIGGLIFIVVERLPSHSNPLGDVTQTSLGQALATGIAQVFALIPGTSRSGACIVGSMLAGLDRRAATAFSFYLALPTLGAATVLELLLSLDQITPDDIVRLLLGMFVSGIVAWLSIAWLLRYVANNSFVPFGIYRIVAGAVILLLVALGRL